MSSIREPWVWGAETPGSLSYKLVLRSPQGFPGWSLGGWEALPFSKPWQPHL